MTDEEKKAIETVENFIKYYKKNEQTGNRANLDVLREEINSIEFILNEYDVFNKEKQADKEKIEELGKDYAEMLIKLNAQNLNNSIEQRKESNEQLEALHEGWKIELEKKDNRIKELESDKEIKDKTIKLMSEHLTTPIHSKKDVIDYFENLAKEIEYYENLAKESGEIDENVLQNKKTR